MNSRIHIWITQWIQLRTRGQDGAIAHSGTDSECAVRGGTADKHALVQRQLITKCELQDESRQRLAAPANWPAGRVWTVPKIDSHSEQRFCSFETGEHGRIRGFAFSDLRTPSYGKE